MLNRHPVATEEFLTSDLDINLDIAELGLYLAVVKDRQQLTTLAWALVNVSRPAPQYHKETWITTEEILSRETTVSKFGDPARTPIKEQIRLIFSEALEHLIIMESHIYTYDGQLLR